jgi:hypothetical protein
MKTDAHFREYFVVANLCNSGISVRYKLGPKKQLTT